MSGASSPPPLPPEPVFFCYPEPVFFPCGEWGDPLNRRKGCEALGYLQTALTLARAWAIDKNDRTFPGKIHTNLHLFKFARGQVMAMLRDTHKDARGAGATDRRQFVMEQLAVLPDELIPAVLGTIQKYFAITDEQQQRRMAAFANLQKGLQEQFGIR